MQRILVPVDYTDGARVACRYAAELAAGAGGSIELFFAWSAPFFADDYMAKSGSGPSLFELVREQALVEMDAFVESCGIDSDIVSRRAVVSGDPKRAIVERATEGDFDLIVMGTESGSTVHRLLLGSVAQAVLRTAPCPVLTVPPRFGPQSD